MNVIVDQAYTVVGPTNFQPCFLSSFDRAGDSAEVDTACGFAVVFALGSYRQMNLASEPLS